jgi:hypothetical protein
MHNNSMEPWKNTRIFDGRSQEHDFMYDVAVLHRSLPRTQDRQFAAVGQQLGVQ